jgi:ribosomal protein L40E
MSDTQVKTCPMCGNQSPLKALTCRACGEEFSRLQSRSQRTWQELRQIAIYQKAILTCILLYLVAIFGQFLVPRQFPPPPGFSVVGLGIGVVVLGVFLAAMVFNFLLAVRVYNLPVAILFGLLTLFPPVGLIIMLVINGKATRVLTENGKKVGLLGASLSQFKTMAD